MLYRFILTFTIAIALSRSDLVSVRPFSAIDFSKEELTSICLVLLQSKKQFMNEAEFKANQRINDLECQVSHYMESAGKLQAEVDRLLTVMRNQDLERSEKERHIAELEE